MNRKRWLTLGVVTAVIVTILLIGFSLNRTNTESAAAQDIETAVAFIGDLTATASASGQLLPQRQAVLTADIMARVVDVPVRLGDNVQAGDLLVQLDSTDLQFDVNNAQQNVALAQARLEDLLAPASDAEIASAEADLASAQAQLDDLLAGPSETEVALSQATLASAQASLASSVADLSSVQNSMKQSQITAAQANLLAAQQQLENAIEVNEENPTAANHEARLHAEQAVTDAQAQLDKLLAGPSVGAGQSSVAAANARLEGSQINLEATLAGATTAEIAQAQATVAQAEATLADLLAGPAPEEVQVVEAELAQAELNLAEAEEALAKTSLTAPFAGVVTAVYVAEGEIAGGPVVALVDTHSLEVVLSVDEVDIGSFAVGQPASITLEAWPEREIESEIVTIAPGSNSSTAPAAYDVHLAYPAADLPPLVGLTANANLITARRENVLLVPNAAITPDRAAGKYFVDVQQADGRFHQVEVSIGLRDEKNTQITAGLAVGDVVRLIIVQPNHNATAQTPQTGEIVTAFVGDLSASVTAGGHLEATQAAELALLRGGTVAEIYVAVGDAVVAGDPLLQSETANLQRAVTTAAQNVIIQEANLAALLAPSTDADVAAAEAAVFSAEAQLADLLGGPDAGDIAAAQANVRAAQADLNAAYARLADLTAAADAEEIEAAQIQLELAQTAATQAAEQHSTILVSESDFLSAEQLADMELAARTAAVQANAALQAAQETLDELLNGNPSAIATAQASVSLAAASLQTAELRLQQVLAGASAAQIAQAKANLANANASLDRLERGASGAQISMAQAQLAQAQTSLARAERNLANATLSAPYDGVITAVHVNSGEQAGGVLVEMVNPDSLELVLDVDEVDISSIFVGQTAVINLEAFPESEIEAVVVSIAPRNTASQGSGLATYAVYLALSATDLPLRVGLTANANLITAQRSDVLLVPNRAITPDRAAGKYYVTRASGAVIEVTIGLRDAENTQITSGLAAGDELLIETANTETRLRPGSRLLGGN